MWPYGIRPGDQVGWQCCTGHDNYERRYLIRKLWRGAKGKLGNGLSAKNRDRARKKHAKQETRLEIIKHLEDMYD